MKVMDTLIINKERLKETFIELVNIESPSRHEEEVCWYLKKVFKDELGFTVIEDSSQEITHSNANNLIVKIPGNPELSTLLFNAHMDTVTPARGVRCCFKDGIFFSEGDTVLGGDDKAACAILIEVGRCLKEFYNSGSAKGDAPYNNFPPLEFLFTVCEEIGLLGAKALDVGLLEASAGYALDATGTFNLINRAPAGIKFKIIVKGKGAHAGIEPEKGLNAISLASKAINSLSVGRIDEITTSNIGLIRGGTATNIVPDEVIVEGEARSHSEERLKKCLDDILGAFHSLNRHKYSQDGIRPVIQTEVINDYPLLNISDDHPLIKAAENACKDLKRSLTLQDTGGGSDANILCGKGIDMALIGIGMENVHTVDERIALQDMTDTGAFILKIIANWGYKRS